MTKKEIAKSFLQYYEKVGEPDVLSGETTAHALA